MNQLLVQGSDTLVYDLNGNLQDYSNGNDCIHYSYDALDRLIQITKEKQIQVCYGYDHFNRRIEKESFVWREQDWVKDKTQQFLYTEQNEIGAYEQGKLTELRILEKV